MKRFFIKSIACLFIAFLLASFLPNTFIVENKTISYSKKVYADSFSAFSAGDKSTTTQKVIQDTAKSMAAGKVVSQNTTETLTAKEMSGIMISLTETQKAFNSLDKDYNDAINERQGFEESLKNATSEEEKTKIQSKIDSLNKEISYLGQQRQDTLNDLNQLKTQKEAVDAQLASSNGDGEFSISGKPIGGISGWVIAGFNWILYGITSALGWVLGWVGKAVDESINWSQGMGNQTRIIDAITKNWTVFRDTFNLLFIFILLYISIQTILQGGKANTKKMLSGVIVAALLINFSLMITRAIIDTSNIFTLSIYNKGMSVTGKNATVTSQIMDAVRPQSMDNIMKDSKTGQTVLATSSLGLTIVLILKIIVVILLLWAFCKVLLLLITRLVMFFLLMGLSPIGFVGNVVPKVGEYSDKWWKALIDQSLVGPVFAFLMTVSASVMATFSDQIVGKTLAEAGANGQGAQAMVGLIFNLSICVGLVIATVNITKKFSGEAGAAISKAVGSVAGLAIGGVGGFALRNTLGRGAAALVNNEKFKSMASNNMVGRLALKGTDAVSKSSLDFRNTDAAKKAGKELGMNFGKGGGKDGFQGQVKKVGKWTEDTAKLMETDLQARDMKPQLKTAVVSELNKGMQDDISTKAKLSSEKESMQKEYQLLEERLKAKGLSADKRDELISEKIEMEKKMKAKGDEIVKRERERGEKEKKLQEIESGEREVKVDDLSKDGQNKLKTQHQKTYAEDIDKSVLTHIMAGAKGKRDAANKVRKLTKGKSKDEQIAELAREIEKEKGEKEKSKEEPKKEEGGDKGKK